MHMPTQLDADSYEEEGTLAVIQKERQYSYNDVITVSPNTLPNYEQKVHTERLICSWTLFYM